MREKLIELMNEAEEYEVNTCMFHSECEDCPGRKYGNNCRDYLKADHLITNGVTVQKWIPVTERLPEVVDSYIVVVKCKQDWEKEFEIGVDVATYDPYSDNPYIDGCWNTYNDWDEGQQYLRVTHWMPLPPAPKGE